MTTNLCFTDIQAMDIFKVVYQGKCALTRATSDIQHQPFPKAILLKWKYMNRFCIDIYESDNIIVVHLKKRRKWGSVWGSILLSQFSPLHHAPFRFSPFIPFQLFSSPFFIFPCTLLLCYFPFLLRGLFLMLHAPFSNFPLPNSPFWKSVCSLLQNDHLIASCSFTYFRVCFLLQDYPYWGYIPGILICSTLPFFQ